jgi:threonine dehydratase
MRAAMPFSEIEADLDLGHRAVLVLDVVPGRHLAKVAQLIADAAGNIVEVQHQRIFGTSSVRSPEVEFLVETRARAHTDALLQSLRHKAIRVAAF